MREGEVARGKMCIRDSNYGGLCRIYKAEEGAPANICMNEEDLKIFLPMSAEALASDSQENGVAQVTVKGGAK